MSRTEKAFRFTICLLPAALAGGWFTAKYSLEVMDPDLLAEAASRLSSIKNLIVISMLQSVLYAAFCGFLGYILSEKIGLMRSLRGDRTLILKTVLVSFPAGILFSLDPWIFGKFLPEIAAADTAGLSLNSWLASILYGGIIEEVMMRLFLMSLIAWLVWKIFLRDRISVPKSVLIGANFTAAAVFAAGHLPFTFTVFGRLSPVILLRCFLLNGGYGLLFGRLYRKYGIQYAMLSHIILHIVSKTVWTLF